jgi:squalene-hopene/tetraprenyl-beta-curcumene cyclase
LTQIKPTKIRVGQRAIAVVMIDPDRLCAAYFTARDALLAERTPEGFWVGELSTSALSTAVAVIALHLVDPQKHRSLIAGGVRWLAENQNADGGWGDTTKSFSNISTSMLGRAAFAITAAEKDYSVTIDRIESYLSEHCGRTAAERAEAIRRRYGTDRTFSVPILMTCALAGLVPWREVPRLPFELACLPQSWYRFARLPVVSYALPALIAIGQCVHYHRPTWNPVTGPLRWMSKSQSLRVLRRIQPTSGGYLEATPLTSFVVMSLASIGHAKHEVTREGVRFIVESVRPDGSWPIDTNLSVWVTTLSVNALAAADDLEALDQKDELLAWLIAQQTQSRHPYTGADPGGWGWSHCPGSVPDCDDTPGAMLAVKHLGYEGESLTQGQNWMRGLINRDGGLPTFCRGWGKLPFDRSGSDLTAHFLRAMAASWPSWFLYRDVSHAPGFPPITNHDLLVMTDMKSALRYLHRQQRPDGSWLPLWFGNQHAPDDENPVYGTCRVLAAYCDLGLSDSPECQRGVRYLLSVQNPDGGWGGAKGCPSSVEETALAVEVLLTLAPPQATSQMQRGIMWLVAAVESGRFREPSPIGFYFAKLWYYEKLYPLIFTVAALGRAASQVRRPVRA